MAAQFHEFETPIRRVAVVGAGPSGLTATRHLKESGLQVRLFDRQSGPGGIWNWSPDAAPPLSIPTPPPSRAAFYPVAEVDQHSTNSLTHEERLKFSPPNPCYWALTNNVPTYTMAFKDFPYPAGTQPNISHRLIVDYQRSYARHFGLDEIASYNTRVENVEQNRGLGPRWKVTLQKVEDDNGHFRSQFWTEEFDALVIATGHYNAPYIPPMTGLSAWAERWPTSIYHSQAYRVPKPFEGKTVLIIGTGTSGIDISRDLSPHVEKIYMVGKNELRGPAAYVGMRKMQRHLLPANAEQLLEIEEFLRPDSGEIEQGAILLTDGRTVSGIDAIIFATGYQYSYPFLPHLHRDPAPSSSKESPAADDSNLLITDGEGVLNLYRDVFYIPDPTLAFLGLSVNTSAFSFFEYQGLAVSRVFSHHARLPDLAGRQQFYKDLVSLKGAGKFAHFLGKDGERQYVRETVEWLNAEADVFGVAPIQGHSQEWLAASDNTLTLLAARYGLDIEVFKALRGGLNGAPLEKNTEPDKLNQERCRDQVESTDSFDAPKRTLIASQ